MIKIKKIINPILLGVLMSLCLVAVSRAAEVPVLESSENVDATARNPEIPTLENATIIEEEVAVEETTTEVSEKKMEPENVTQPQDDYASIAKIILIGASIVALLVLLANRIYNKRGIKN